MKTLKHNDCVRLSGWGFATASIGTVIGYSRQNSQHDDESLYYWRRNGGPYVWANYTGTILSTNPSFYERDRQRYADAIVLNEGETIIVEGHYYDVKVMPRCHDMPRYSDPIHFEPTPY